jgi:hypothetical protein
MKDKIFKCLNCDFHPSTDLDIWFGIKINACPQCRNLLPETVNYIENYFRIIQLVKPLEEAEDLLLKSKSRFG